MQYSALAIMALVCSAAQVAARPFSILHEKNGVVVLSNGHGATQLVRSKDVPIAALVFDWAWAASDDMVHFVKLALHDLLLGNGWCDRPPSSRAEGMV